LLHFVLNGFETADANCYKYTLFHLPTWLEIIHLLPDKYLLYKLGEIFMKGLRLDTLFAAFLRMFKQGVISRSKKRSCYFEFSGI